MRKVWAVFVRLGLRGCTKLVGIKQNGGRFYLEKKTNLFVRFNERDISNSSK